MIQRTPISRRRTLVFILGAAAVSSLPWRLVFSPRHGAIRRLALQPGKATSRSPPGRFRPPPQPRTRFTDCAPGVGQTMTNTVSHLCGFADTTHTGVPSGTTLYPASAAPGA